MLCQNERLAWVMLAALSASCGAAAPAASPPVARSAAVPAPAPAAPSVSATDAASPPPEPADSAGFREALSLLRPPAAAPALAALEAAPRGPAEYAQAAIAYASTEVPAMTLLWGMSYQAMGGGAAEASVAQAILKVLNERVTVERDTRSDRVEYNVRLAPGSMPVRQDASGATEAPLAHVFEGLFSPTLLGFSPPWSIEEFYDALSSWVGVVSARGTPLDEVLELNGWLVTLAKAGHLEAYCFRLLGSAFAAELKAYKAGHARELNALSDYLNSNALQPKRAVMPDDLIRLK